MSEPSDTVAHSMILTGSSVGDLSARSAPVPDSAVSTGPLPRPPADGHQTAVEDAPAAQAPAVDGARQVVSYLVAPEAEQYLAVMAVLEASVEDLTPAQVLRAVADQLGAGAGGLDSRSVETRLEQLRSWGAATARTDTSEARRYTDLLLRNWRYTATPAGREVQRFYVQRLAGTQLAREIPLGSLQRALSSLQQLRALLQDLPGGAGVQELTVEQVAALAEHTATLFVSHDDLDGALVGAEDTLAGLADRFDLDGSDTSALKDLLIEYATRIANELSHGSAQAHAALLEFGQHVPLLCAASVQASLASELIRRGALDASRGGRQQDWDGLLRWFDPARGRAARLSLSLVRAVPGMQANLRRLHSSSGTATARARALLLAKACTDPELGRDILLAATGDHAWRKLHGVADAQPGRNPSWHTGPVVQVGDILRTTGRSGSRGRAAVARSDVLARAEVTAQRAERERIRLAAVEEILTATAGSTLTPSAAALALAALTCTARIAARGRVRLAVQTKLGIACTLVFTPGVHGRICAPHWSVHTMDRTPVFHRLGVAPDLAAHLESDCGPDLARRVRLEVVA